MAEEVRHNRVEGALGRHRWGADSVSGVWRIAGLGATRDLHHGLQGVRRYRVTIDGRIYDVEIDDPNARPVTARLSGVAYSVDVDPERLGDISPQQEARDDRPASGAVPAPPTAPTEPTADPRGAGPRAITAPIPGVVASVAARAGETIERGDELLTLDAMKMLNVIRSPWAGTIATVHVEKGDRVVHGEPLVTFVPS